jgi:DNA-binding phage protein
MAREIRRIRRAEKLSAEEAERIARLRSQIAEELPDIRKRARARLIEVTEALTALRAERERQGLSLADVRERSGIERSALSRLENEVGANPTIHTLVRYAESLGKKIVIQLVDAD